MIVVVPASWKFGDSDDETLHKRDEERIGVHKYRGGHD